MEETFYKIRRRHDGLFSKGGYTPRFNTKGKIWHGMGPLRNHINGLSNPHEYNGCEIVEFMTKEVNSKPAIDEIIESQERTRKRKEERQLPHG